MGTTKTRRDASNTPLAAIMTTHVVCAYASDSIETVRTLMMDEGISGLPVLDEHGRLCGVVSKTDLVRDTWVAEDASRLARDLDRNERAQLGTGFHLAPEPQSTVGDVMTPLAVTLPPDISVARAAALMAHKGLHRVIVTDAADTVVGVVSLLDIARWTAQRAGFILPGVPDSLLAAA